MPAPHGGAGCWGRFVEMGWLGLSFDEADGGFGGGPADLAVLMREFGRSLVVEPYRRSAAPTSTSASSN